MDEKWGAGQVNWMDPFGLDRLINPRPGGPSGPLITFVNDDPNGASPNQPVTDATADGRERGSQFRRVFGEHQQHHGWSCFEPG